MSGIDKYFKSKKTNPIQEEFIRQCEQQKKESDEPQIEWIKEKSKLQSTINSLESENRDIKQKYERLKAKHVTLLQMLLTKEQKIQNLENRGGSLMENTVKTKSKIDVLVELVISHFILK